MSQFEGIAQQYQNSKQLPFRRYVEAYTIFSLLPEIKGKIVLDLACGEGIYARSAKCKGAKKVVGVDSSIAMLNLAKQKNRGLDIEYLYSDIRELPFLGEFDIVLANYIFNYAQNKQQLTQFCEKSYQHLKPGGLLVGVNDNPFNRVDDDIYSTYGFSRAVKNKEKDIGNVIKYTFFADKPMQFSFNNYYIAPDIYQKVFKQVGFVNFTWSPIQLSGEGISVLGSSYWNTLLEKPPIIAFHAKK